MTVFIVYAHPSRESFTCHAKNRFIDGVRDAGHRAIVSDLYDMNFQTDMTEAEYLRESNYQSEAPLPPDVLAEQEKINRADAIAFLYPVFWTEAPAKLVGWFDRVWTYGFAYGERRMKTLRKGLVLCVTGHSREKLEEYGHLQSMKTVMLNDRLFDRVREKEFIVLDEMTKYDEQKRNALWDHHLRTAYAAGRGILTEGDAQNATQK